MARRSTSMWSPAWLLPALPGRNVTASSSVVLSHHTPSGWNPKPPLNVAAACSFSECAVTSVASTSSTTISAQIDAGDLGRPARSAAGSTRGGGSGPGPSRPASAPLGWPHPTLRHTVGGDATGPSSPALMAKGVDVGDRLTPGGQHHSDVHPDLAAVMDQE